MLPKINHHYWRNSIIENDNSFQFCYITTKSICNLTPVYFYFTAEIGFHNPIFLWLILLDIAY